MRPVFYVRPRDYSKAVPVAPFIVNYSGALFREYPGPWQVRGAGGWVSCEVVQRERGELFPDSGQLGCSG